MKYLYVLFVSVAIFSCSSNNRTCELIDLGSETIVSPSLFSDSIIMAPPLQLKSFDKYLAFIYPGMGRSILFVDTQTKKEQNWGKIGDGPEDFISVSCVGQKENRVALYDGNLRKYVEYEILLGEEIELERVKKQQLSVDSLSILGIHTMSNGLTVGFVGLGSKELFSLFGKNLNFIKTFGKCPVDGLPEDNNLQMYGWFSSYGDRLYWASQTTGYVVCYTVKSNEQIAKNWELYLNEPLYDKERMNWNKNNKEGAYDIQATKDYVFISYSGKLLDDEQCLPQNILVFTHDGELIKNVKYENEYVPKFTVADNKIYTFGKDRITECNLADWKLEHIN